MRNALLALSLSLACLGSHAQTASVSLTEALALATDYESPADHRATSRPDQFSEDELDEIRERLRNMDCIIDVREHPVVESYLRGYLLRNREKSERILGRIPAYFPLFEQKLREAGLPDDLKYLAVVESALSCRALSRSGAGGLWQFMPGTGKDFGLVIDQTVDQRGDPQLSTEAAIAYLGDEYERFGDWSLVLAAYNGGPGRVMRAVKQVGKHDFWKIHALLPRETRNYVPAFVAAMYLHKYGHLHGLQPVAPPLDEQLLVSIACPAGINLGEVAQATDLPLNLVQSLNPHCLKNYLPAGPRANCRIPARAAEALQTYLTLRVDDPEHPMLAAIRARPILIDSFANFDHLYQRQDIYLAGGQTFGQMASELGVSEHHLRVWNPAQPPYSSQGRQLSFYSYGDAGGQAALYGAAHRHQSLRRPSTARGAADANTFGAHQSS